MKKRVSRTLDPLGRIVIPAEFRQRIGIEKGEDVEVICEKDQIIIRKPSPRGIVIPLNRNH